MSRTRHLLVLGIATALVACAGDLSSPQGSADELAPLILAAPGAGVEGLYVVVLKPAPQPTSAAMASAARAGVTPRYVYRAARPGFGAELSDAQVAELRADPSIDWIEQAVRVSVGRTQFMNAAGQPWGLDRIDQAALPLSGSYTYTRRASQVTVYIIDTGIRASHWQFTSGGSRAQNVFDAYGGDGDDCNGHGTHVAGIVGGRIFGVAKRVQLRGVRAFDCDGGATTLEIIAGIDFVLENFQAPAVANMSFTSIYSKSVNLWVDALADGGVFPAAAAGNEEDYSCLYSPASALGAFTVAASDDTDLPADFTNWGRCVDIYAPGVNIKSAWLSGSAIASGTSIAAPHVAGVAALLKERWGDLSSEQIAKKLRKLAVADVIVDNDAGFISYGTPNLLLQKRGL
jgi:subtilisin family serine protease